MKMVVTFLLALLTAGSLSLAENSGNEIPKTAREARKICKTQAAGDKGTFKKCMKAWKKAHKNK